MKKICIIAGARPNFIKVAPIVRAIENAAKRGHAIGYELLFVGREDDPTLETSLFDDLQMARPTVFLGVDSTNVNELTGLVMSAFERHLQSHPADIVIVVDDLASTMAAAIVAKRQKLVLAHLVAGTRSFDINMPKEVNRLVIDGLSDLLFTAGMSSNSAATKEGAGQEKIYMVGNILMDSLRYNYSRLRRPALFDSLQLPDRSYLVFTLNRKALIADRDNLRQMVCAMAQSAGTMPIVAPLRGLAAQALRDVLTEEYTNIHLVDPLPYLEFGYLTAHAAGVITDSGNVAEEATFNRVPCITLNSYTEHIETVTVGTNVLVGEDPSQLADQVGRIVSKDWKNSSLPDRWDGRSAERIVQILLDYKHQTTA